ncbi:YpzI family protein [Halalkalibacter urbisdiaboli]|nr:YpzI family protein [Halalkalibacter urbisdiaboli]
MGKDRMEKKQKQNHQVDPDRDQSLDYPGSAKLQSPEQARKQQRR